MPLPCVRAVLDYIHRLASPKEIEAAVIVDPHSGTPVVTGRIVLGEPSQTGRARGLISIDELLRHADQALTQLDFSVWILLDRLDVAFEQHEDLEQNALRALFKAYLDMNGLNRITLKIFLRNDIWDHITEVGFREASHISAELNIDWDRHNLLQLMMRRVLKNDSIANHYRVEPAIIFRDVEEQIRLFERMMPILSDTGGEPMFDWIVSHTTDASGQSAPRELIHLLSAARARQLSRLEVGNPAPPREELFDRIALKEALYDVSEGRLKKLLYAEYPDLKPYIARLNGEKAQHSLATLAHIWELDMSDTSAIADRLTTVGFFSRSGDGSNPDYEVPPLYRSVLNIVRGKARAPAS